MRRIYIIVLLMGLLAVALLSHKRFDLTADKRYTLAPATIKLLNSVREPVHIEVYLKGSFPSYFRKLSEETQMLLQQFHHINSKITFDFTDPLKSNLSGKLQREGMIPAEITVRKGNELTGITVFPWAVIFIGDESVQVPLLVDIPGIGVEEQINRSIEQLEYAFAYRFSELLVKEKPAVAILKGNGELPDVYLASFLTALRDFYRLAPFTLDSIKVNPQRTLEQLKQFDLVIVAKPTEKFSPEEKFTLDQYLMNGGKLLLLIDPVKAHKDTLMYRHRTYALNAELDLTDWLFGYGVRLEPVLVKDWQAAPVTLKVGQVGKNPQLQSFPWYYSPLVIPEQDNPIGKNTGKIKLDFVSIIDTLPGGPPKTVLLKSSPHTEIIGVPVQINFSEIARKPDPARFNAGEKIFGILLEGQFKSAYAGRVKPFDISTKDSAKTKMILIADGDIIKNDVGRNGPIPLGYDRYSRMTFDNLSFLLNAVHYLTDKSGLFLLKTKEVRPALIDKNRAVAEGGFWQWFGFLLPLLLVSFPVIMYQYLRKKHYA